VRVAFNAIALCVLLAGCSSSPPASSPSGERPQELSSGAASTEGETMLEVRNAPRATVQPESLEIHGDVRIDDYYWLKDRGNPEVIAYLEAENAYAQATLAHTETLQEKLFEEIVGRIKKDDSTVPYRFGSYEYYERYEEGLEYPIYVRRRSSRDSAEEVLIDANELAVGHDYLQVRGVKVSSGQTLLAYATDTVGRRMYTLRFRDLETGEELADTIPNITGNHVWANDNKTLFYTQQDPETLRWSRIFRHVVGSDPATDVLVYEETDEEFSTFVTKTKSQRFIFIASEQTLSSEYRFLDANRPEDDFRVFLPREARHEYSLDHLDETFYIRTNWKAKNFRLMAAPIRSTGKEQWSEVIAHRNDVFLGETEIFRDFLVVSERRSGLVQMRVIPWDGSGEHYLDFGEPAYDATFGDNKNVDTTVLRYEYTSLTTPDSVFDYDMATRKKTLLKEEEVLGGFDKSDYVTERLWAKARDGVDVPISIVYRRGFMKDGTAPLLLYGYGSYGYAIDASFNVDRLALLDRGFAFAIAHIRGGQELGREWYESGKLFAKMNTFNDFIDCGRYLVAEEYAAGDRLFAMGGSAGGLLMGAVVNLAPDLFAGIVSRVPFVDVVTTMLDSDIPLTTSEYDEWGDPNEEPSYRYMLSYSPYDRLEKKAYPSMLVTAGFHDSQVQYWEPAKYVAKLRTLKTDDNPLVLRTNLDAGHSGASGRFERYRETAVAYAFMLDLAGIEE